MNLTELVDYGNAEEVARKIGIETRRVGSKIAIRCPSHIKMVGHQDRHIGNCFLSAKGYICYSCGAKGNFVKMAADFWDLPYESIEDKKNISKQVAQDVYPEIAKQVYAAKSDSKNRMVKRTAPILTDEEIKTIGMVVSVYTKDIDIKRFIEEEKEREEFGCYTAREFMKEDPEGYSIMALGKAYERNKSLVSIYKILREKNSDMAGALVEMINETRKICSKLEKYIAKNYPQYKIQFTVPLTA